MYGIFMLLSDVHDNHADHGGLSVFELNISSTTRPYKHDFLLLASWLTFMQIQLKTIYGAHVQCEVSCACMTARTHQNISSWWLGTRAMDHMMDDTPKILFTSS